MDRQRKKARRNVGLKALSIALALVLVVGLIPALALGNITDTQTGDTTTESEGSPNGSDSQEVLTTGDSENIEEGVDNQIPDLARYTVNFMTEEGLYLAVQDVVEGSLIGEPQTSPPAPEGQILRGWVSSEILINVPTYDDVTEDMFWKFSEYIVSNNINLYAVFGVGSLPLLSGGITPNSTMLMMGETTYTVTFMSNGEVFDTVDVVEGATCSELPQPSKTSEFWPAGAARFTGWFKDGTDTLFDFANTPITADTTLTAGYTNELIVNYLDKPYDIGGVVVDQQVAKPGDPVKGPSIAIEPPANSRIDYWYDVDTDEVVEFWTTEVTDRDMFIAPHFSNEFYAYFVSEGTQVAPATVIGGQQLVKPTNPTREGYKFSHWSEVKGAPKTSAYTFSNPVTSDLTLYANWTGDTVNYTVAIYLEKPNFSGAPQPGNSSQYDYIGSVSLSGIAGTMTTIKTTLPGDIPKYFGGNSAGPGNAFNNLRYAVAQQDLVVDKIIQGNGGTVVNLYASRKVYTYEFPAGTTKVSTNKTTENTFVINDVTYGNGTAYPVYTLNVKFEQDLRTTWPSMPNMTSNNFKFNAWDCKDAGTYETTALQSIRPTVDSSILSKDGQKKTYTFKATASSDGKHTYRYFVEITYQEYLDLSGGSDIVIQQNIKGTAGSGSSASPTGGTNRYFREMREYEIAMIAGNYAKAINGMTAINTSTTWQFNSNYTFYKSTKTPPTGGFQGFFYAPNEYTLSFNANRPDGATGTVGNMPANYQVKYMAAINRVPAQIPTLDGFVFKGWYKSADCLEGDEFEFTTEDTIMRMPNQNLQAFAKWESNEFTVSFYDDAQLIEDNLIKVVGKAKNQYVNDNDSPYDLNDSVEGRGVFTGWNFYTNESKTRSMPYNFDIPITGDLELFATWSKDGYGVTYDLNGGTGTVPVDAYKYDITKLVRVQSGEGLKSGDMIFVGWIASSQGRTDTTIYQDGMLYTISGPVTFIAQYGNRADYVDLIYHSNNGESSTAIQHVLKGTAPNPLLGAGTFTWPNHELLGWATEAGGAIVYELGDTTYPQMEANADLYAVWSAIKWTVEFTVDPEDTGFGTLSGTARFTEIDDNALFTSVVTPPEPQAATGYEFVGWTFGTRTGDSVELPTAANDKNIKSDEYYIAHFKAIDYTITYIYADGSPENVPTLPVDTNKYHVGEIVTNIAALPSMTGYSFTGWTYLGGNYNPSNNLTMPAANVTLVGTWAPNPHNITYSYNNTPDGAPNPPAAAQNVAYGTTKTVEAIPVMAGYTFDGWSTDDATVTGETVKTFVMPDKDVAFAGTWVPNQHKVTYSYIGEFIPENAPDLPDEQLNVDFGTAMNRAPAPSLAGYTFSGWTSEQVTPVTSGAYSMPDADVLFVGSWTANGDTGYAVEHYTVDENGVATLNGEREVLSGTTGATVYATARSIEGYTYVAGYFNGDDVETASGVILGNGSLVLKLYYTVNQHDVTYSYLNTAVGAPELPAGATNVPFGTSMEVADNPVLTGYEFSGWSTEDVTIDENGDYTMPNNAVAFVGSWAIKSFNITYNYIGDLIPTGADEQKPAPQNGVDYGTSVNVANAPVVQGYTFSGWTSAQVTPVEGTFNMPSVNVVFTGSWSTNKNTSYIEQHWLVLAYGEEVLAEAATPKTGETGQIVTIDPKMFDGYTHSEGHTGERVSGPIASDGSLVLKLYYTPNLHTISYTYSITPDGAPDLPESEANVPFGASKEVYANPVMAGYSFSGWTAANVTLTGTSFSMPDDDVVFVGTWTPNQHNVSYSYSGELIPEGATEQLPEDQQDIDFGTTMQRAENPELAGYTFSGWTSEHVSPDTNGAYSMPDNNVVFVGSWTANGDTGYTVEHYTVGVDGVAALYGTPQSLSGTTGATVEASPISIEGYTYKAGYSEGDNVETASGEILGNGSLVLQLYYTINYHKVTYRYTNTPVGAPPAPVGETEVAFGASMTVADDQELPGYTFQTWQTSDVTLSGADYTMPDKDVEFIGGWVPLAEKLTYFANGGSGGPHEQQGKVNEEVTVVSPVAAEISRVGFDFIGWNTQADGNGLAYGIGEGFELIFEGTNELYAQWQAAPVRYTVHYVDVEGNEVAGSVVKSGNYNDIVRGQAEADLKGAIEGFTYRNSTPDYISLAAAPAINEITLVYVANAPIIPLTPEPETSTPETSTPEVPTPETPAVSPNPSITPAITQSIGAMETPLAGANYGGAWALLNLILSVLGAVLALTVIIAYFLSRKKEDEEADESEEAVYERAAYAGAAYSFDDDEEEPETAKKRMTLRIIGAVIALIAIILFILTEDMSLPMVFVDMWTIAHIIIFAIQAVVTVFAVRRVRVEDEREDEAAEGSAA